MKRAMKYISSILFTALILIMAIHPFRATAQDEEVTTTLELMTIKKSQNVMHLTATLTADDGSSFAGESGLEVNFYAVNDGEELLLGNAPVNDKGKAGFSAEDLSLVKPDESGYLHFTARFDGHGKFGASEASAQAMDAWLELEFFEEESARYIRYSGFFKGPDGTVNPIADQDVYLYTPRMFSLMKLEDGWLESEGTAVADFPEHVIGDTLGNVEIIVRIEEHPDFGNVEASRTIDWAIPKHSERAEGPSRELWTPIAPLWMIVTLIIMLTGVWAHYFYAVWQLYMIRRAGKKKP